MRLVHSVYFPFTNCQKNESSENEFRNNYWIMEMKCNLIITSSIMTFTCTLPRIRACSLCDIPEAFLPKHMINSFVIGDDD